MNSKSIVFFGTGSVSLASLEALAKHFTIEFVVTKPDVIVHGQPHRLPVKQWANSNRIPSFEPGNASELSAIFQSQKPQSPVGVVVDYGVLIPLDVIEAFTKGIINAHYSLLPKWRGADPVRAAILNGETETGVSLMLIDEKLDTGDLIAQAKIAVGSKEDVQSLYEKLVDLGNKLLISTIPPYLAGKISAKPQEGVPTYAPRLAKEAGAINWDEPADQVERQIRAYLGWPGSYGSLAEKAVIITKARVGKGSGNSGEINQSGEELEVYCGKGSLVIERLKPAGKNEMSGAEFKRGYLRAAR
jgi:methionyl-tRNA formyltransferase